MPKENNKMQVDIENLFKQNVNDLLSIKELYKRIEELGEKITQIKYIDNTIVKKIKKEYEKLNKIILDENIQIELSSKLDTKTSYVNNITMLRNGTFKDGDFVETLGFYNVNDGGGAKYKIVKTTEKDIDNVTIIKLNNNMYAEMIIVNNEINPKQFGAKGILNSNFDDMSCFQLMANFINKYKTVNKIKIPYGHYYFSALDENGEMPIPRTNPKRINFFKVDGLTIVGDGCPIFYMTDLNCNWLNEQVDPNSQGNEVFCCFTATRCDNVLIENIEFRGTFITPWVKFKFYREPNGTSVTAPRAKAISIRGCNNVTIRKIKGYDICGNLIALGCSDTEVDKDPNESIGGFRECKNSYLSDIYINRTFENGINYFGGCFDSYVDNVWAKNCTNSIEIASDGANLNNITALECRGAGITLTGKNQNATNLYLYDCKRLEENGNVDPNYAVGLNIQQGENITVNNITVKGCTKQGINVHMLSKNIVINNAVVRDNCTILNEPQVTIKGNDVNNTIKEVMLTNSIIDGSSIVDSSYTHAPILIAQVDGITITNNVIKKSSNSSSSINAYNNNNNLLICNNRLDKNVSVNETAIVNIFNNFGITEDRRIFQGYQVPTKGTWRLGDFVRIYNVAKITIDGIEYLHTGWRCTSAGTPGTWKKELIRTADLK